MTSDDRVCVVGFMGKERMLPAETPCLRMPREDFDVLMRGDQGADLRATRQTNISPFLSAGDRATYEGASTTLAECADGDTIYVGGLEGSDSWEASRVKRHA
jgi:hypothetical protein